MYNVARFASQFEPPSTLDVTPSDLPIEDKWILGVFDETLERVDRAWQAIDIYTAAQALKTFATGVLPSHWMEMSKSRLYDGDPAATFVIHRIVRDMMTAFCPVIPFFTHHISFTLYGTSALDRRSFPNQSDAGGHDLGSLTSAIMDFNSMVWKTKKETGIALNAPIGVSKYLQNSRASNPAFDRCTDSNEPSVQTRDGRATIRFGSNLRMCR